jgi:prepilin-type N-terminal cleavage/methylation domain-containing protein
MRSWNRRRPRPGFTLIELLIVMVIIGIVIGFIMVVAMDASRRAEERATQALITKLEVGLMDRLDALLSQRLDANQAHATIAGGGLQRANVVALYDYLRSELPDTFLYDPSNTLYPVNFAAVAYNTGGTPHPSIPAAYAPYILPIGTALVNNPPSSLGAFDPTSPTATNYNPTGTGIFGASYSARAALYKNLGFSPAGYDGVDNDATGSGAGLVDDFGEGGNAKVTANLAKHQPNTARSEMLYALLVEGQGPLGTVFQADDFSNREVRDTDGDNLPEFVDGWGQPIQFYRWPILFHSDVQRGQRLNVAGQSPPQVNFLPPYDQVWEQREQDPLDPNQQLVAPSWWTGIAGSAGRPFFEQYFHILTEPTASSSPNPIQFWDRSGTPTTIYGSIYPRRAFYSKFLIVSGGPDGQLGIYQVPAGSITPAALIQEGAACQFDLTLTLSGAGTVTSQTTIDLQNAGLDDITNHNLQAAAGGLQ